MSNKQNQQPGAGWGGGFVPLPVPDPGRTPQVREEKTVSPESTVEPSGLSKPSVTEVYSRHVGKVTPDDSRFDVC